MKYSSYYPTPLSEIPDITNDNIDVLVNADGSEYTVVVATPDNLKYMMEKDEKTYFAPGTPFAIVEMLTEENIEGLIQALVDKPGLLKLYGMDIQDL